MVDQVVEARAPDRDAQVVHAREIGLGQVAGMMHLREKDLPGQTFRGTPDLHAPLQSPQLAIAESTRITSLEVLKQRSGLKARVDLQQNSHFLPDLGKRILPGPPGV